MQLHQELGPLRTTVTAIADRAGVERLTVYRHFPDEHALHTACQAHFFSVNPPPDPASWTLVSDFDERVRIALTDIYAYWERIQQMAATLLRDNQIDPQRAGAGIVAFIARSREAILTGRPGRGARSRLTRAAVGHAVHYSTWRSLVVDGGLTNTQAATLMTEFVARTVPAERPR